MEDQAFPFASAARKGGPTGFQKSCKDRQSVVLTQVTGSQFVAVIGWCGTFGIYQGLLLGDLHQLLCLALEAPGAKGWNIAKSESPLQATIRRLLEMKGCRH